MSMEDAIKDHAAAIRELAAAVNKRTAWMEEGSEAIMDIKGVLSAGNALPPSFGTAGAPAPEGATKAAEPAKRTNKTAEAVAQNAVKADTELEEAVQKVEADAKAPNGASGAAESAGTSTGAPSEDGDSISTEDVTLDYSKDVKPVLLELFKKKGADALGGLLAKHLPGVPKPKGDMLKAEQLGAVLAEANAILAG